MRVSRTHRQARPAQASLIPAQPQAFRRTAVRTELSGHMRTAAPVFCMLTTLLISLRNSITATRQALEINSDQEISSSLPPSQMARYTLGRRLGWRYSDYCTENLGTRRSLRLRAINYRLDNFVIHGLLFL